MDTSKIREQIEDDVIYLLSKKIIKQKEVADYVTYLYQKRTKRPELTFADRCYIEMICDSIKNKTKK